MGFAFCQTGQNGEQQFALHLSGIDILFFKENVDSHTAELTDSLNALHRVSGKSANGLHNDIIDLAFTSKFIFVVASHVISPVRGAKNFYFIADSSFPIEWEIKKPHDNS